ncbi:beta-N-acetylhexosaminidase [Acholeplasma hippikon]|uniref:Beta-hexosaminidase n=1 Tax=Acholeplasma hippikon TaxID=264636 RepID=A0A449BI73_9MOLU|nr:beta-N-acetylhexosaminidase [Acholeplasma hippikon]VEU82113.1 beta-hexosaminidase [Acholeplasma hippikon]
MFNYDINQMSIDDKIGQLCMFGFDGLTVNDDIIDLIKKYRLGNIILFARNVQSAEQLFNLNKNLQKLALSSIGIPLFISIDQEGGMVTRIFNGSTFFPGAMTISATNEVKNAYKLGQIMGEELNALGINMNLAPVMDVNNNPKNPVIGVRSFSDNPDVVAAYSTAFALGLQEYNVVATAKHFPGHGDTNIDSHLGLPVIKHDLERLKEVEFKPFIHAINHGIKGVMSSHINFPNLTQDEHPATLSKSIMTDLLRDSFGFKGLIVSDGMGMKGVVDKYTTEEACVRAINAGVNLVCVCHSHQPRIETIEHIKQAVLDGRITMETLDNHVKLILEHKKELIHLDLEQSYESIIPIVDNKKHQQFSYQVVEDALTLIKGNPIKLSDKALYLGILPAVLNIADDALGNTKLIGPVKEIKNLDVNIVELNPTSEEIQSYVQLAKNYNQVIFTTYNGNNHEGQINLINELAKLDNDLHVISLRNPYDLYYTKQIKNYVCLYEYTPNSIQVLKKYLKGEITPKGIVPIRYE